MWPSEDNQSQILSFTNSVPNDDEVGIKIANDAIVWAMMGDADDLFTIETFDHYLLYWAVVYECVRF